MKKPQSYIRKISIALIIFATARKLFQQFKAFKKGTKPHKGVGNAKEKD